MRFTILAHGSRGDVQPYVALGTGLRAGVPTVVVPFTADQFFWGRRVHRLGVGPRPIQRRRLTVQSLAEAIRVAVSDERTRQRARALGERLSTEDGVAQAVAVIEGYLSG